MWARRWNDVTRRLPRTRRLAPFGVRDASGLRQTSTTDTPDTLAYAQEYLLKLSLTTLISDFPSSTCARPWQMSLDTLEVVDAQLEAAEAKLLALRRQKNAMSPTHHLPPEVLLRILCYASDDILNGYQRTLFVSRLPSWIKVTQVCHFWREVALSAPTYWADIALHTPSWMRETLARSKSALIRLSYVSLSYKEYVLEPLKQLERVSDLTLMQDNIRDWYLPLIRDQPAPNLRMLHGSTWATTISLPENFRAFILSTCRWSSYQADAGNSDSAPAAPPAPVYSGDPVSLPTLLNLVIYDKNVRNISAFMSNIKLSSAAAVNLKAATSRISDDAATLEPMHKHLLDAASLHTHEHDIGREDITPFSDLYWAGDADESIAFQTSSVLTLSIISPEADNEFSFSRKPNLDQFTPSKGREPVHYGAQLGFSSPELSKGVDLIADVFSRYPTTPANLTRLSIENIDLSEEQWRETFVSCKNILRVTAQSDTAATLIRALFIYDDDQVHDAVPFPRLWHLALARLDLRTFRTVEEGSSTLLELYLTLVRRGQRGIPVGGLKIKGCDVDVEHLETMIRPYLLRRVIAWDKDVDGLTGRETQYEDDAEDDDEGDSDVDMDN
ncbi:unnamed protein product [Peniophora sp. CBMAI 1063]|nr:unnamed protein product [Peniophora sp. CBMAI 1063]